MPRLVHHDVQALRQPGTVPSRESETVTDSRIVKHETSLARLEMPDQGIIDPRIQDNTAVMAQPGLYTSYFNLVRFIGKDGYKSSDYSICLQFHFQLVQSFFIRFNFCRIESEKTEKHPHY